MREPCLPTRLPPTRLSPRQQEVFDLYGEGLCHAEICARLYITDKTVEKHLANIRAKLGLEGFHAVRVAAIEARVCRQHGIAWRPGVCA